MRQIAELNCKELSSGSFTDENQISDGLCKAVFLFVLYGAVFGERSEGMSR